MESNRATSRPSGMTAPMLGEPLPVELMNTIWADQDGVHDALDGADRLATWLQAVEPRLTGAVPHSAPAAGGTPGRDATTATSLDRASVERFRQLRDALRRIAAILTGDTRVAAASPTGDLAAALAVVNAACAHAPAWSRLDWSGEGEPVRTTLVAGTAQDRALSQIAEEAARLLEGSGGTQLRACQAPRCVLYFVRSHPRREWCSADCGNRARVARHYRRHHSAAVAPD